MNIEKCICTFFDILNSNDSDIISKNFFDKNFKKGQLSHHGRSSVNDQSNIKFYLFKN